MSESSISIENLQEKLNEGTTSHLLRHITIQIRTNPGKRIAVSENERAPRGLRELFMVGYSRINDGQARKIRDEKYENYRSQVLGQLKNCKRDISKLISNMEKELDENGHEVVTDYSNPVTLRLQVSTPQEEDFWKVVELMDYGQVVLDNMYSTGLMPMEKKHQLTSTIKDSVEDLGKRIMSLSLAASRVRSSLTNAKSADLDRTAPDSPSEIEPEVANG